ncbi:MAG: hypothetical protein WC753_04585 [Candidatus Gracilibacteria bacterium]|jgi:hypothetical protein
MSDAKKVIADTVAHVDSIIEIINTYEPNRHGSIAITRLEEAVMWINAMAHSYPLKDNNIVENIDHNFDSA